MKTSGNIVLVTGGSSGIGFEFAKQLVALGNTVIATGRDEEKLKKAKSQLPELHVIKSDVSDAAAIASLRDVVLSEFPALNVLVNNAGIMRTINLHEDGVSLDELTREIDINLKGPMRMAKTFLPHLKKQDSAAIVNVSSGLAFTPLPTSPVYCATKAGLHSFTLSLRVQLKNTQVKVFEVAPPATETDLLADAMKNREAMKGVSVMKVQDMVAASIAGLAADKLEIRPGQSNQLKFMSRLAPGFILKQMSGPVDLMLGQTR
ncbi:MAG TPA: SDR family NAD(P)-dependent oxidoreductase [Elusimicrobiota bacterium]|nr:SDR family NAD(P)-dependent oxidoreductase [Elusimicrobiota bacterium]